MSNGALAIGYYGSGTLNVSNFGNVDVSGEDGSDGVAVYLGRHGGSSGTLSLDTNSTMSVDNGALAVGYLGTGTLSITNGGNLDVAGEDKNFGVYLGYNGSATGTATVDDSSFYIDNGALAVGYNGTGVLTIQNGGYMDCLLYTSRCV